jgi:hypothetical protein
MHRDTFSYGNANFNRSQTNICNAVARSPRISHLHSLPMTSDLNQRFCDEAKTFFAGDLVCGSGGQPLRRGPREAKSRK